MGSRRGAFEIIFTKEVIMDEKKWLLYEKLKGLAGKILAISYGPGQLWEQHELICNECEKVADEIVNAAREGQ